MEMFNKNVTDSSISEIDTELTSFSTVAQIHTHSECTMELEKVTEERAQPTAPIEEDEVEAEDCANEQGESEASTVYKTMLAYSQLEQTQDPSWRIAPRFAGAFPRYVTRLQYHYLSPKQAETISKSMKQSKKKPKKRSLKIRV